MPPTLIPGWSAEQLEAHACAVLDREGLLVFRSAAMAALTGSPAMPLGTPARRMKPHRDPTVQPAIGKWLSFILSGAPARLHIYSGEIDLPRLAGGFVRCRWQYFGIPESNPDYHLLIYEPSDLAEPVARQALRMERALFEIRSVVHGVGLTESRREMPEPLDLALLSVRELDVMKLLLDGNSNGEISRQLHVSIETVKSHAKAIFRKLAVHSRAELLSRFITSLGLASAMVQQLPALI